MANSNMHSEKKMFKVDNTSKNNVNINVNKQKNKEFFQKSYKQAIEL